MEAQDEYGGDLDSQIRFILSIGTGHPQMKAVGTSLKSFGKTVLKIALETQMTAERFEREHRNLSDIDGYFRFNPPDLDEVGLDEARKKDVIAQRVAAYGRILSVEKDMKRFGVSAMADQRE